MLFLHINLIKEFIPELFYSLSFVYLLEFFYFIVEDEFDECCDSNDGCNDKCCGICALCLSKMFGASYLEETMEEDDGAEDKEEEF